MRLIPRAYYRPTFVKNQNVKLTKTFIEKIEPPASGQAFYRDTALTCFALRVASGGTKTFIVEKRIDGHNRRRSLGRVGEVTCEEARNHARRFLGQVAGGIDPIAEREKQRLNRTTVNQAFEEFKRAKKDLKAKTIYDYGRILKGPLAAWADHPIVKIRPRDVLKLHRQIGEDRGERQANLSMRFLSSVYNFAVGYYRDPNGERILPPNPIDILSETKAWYREERRRSVIKVYDLPAWYRAVHALKFSKARIADAVADWLILMLFTGLRRGEATHLTWDCIDLRDRTLFIPDPKNREPHTLPIGDHLATLLGIRREYAANKYVFPGDGPKGHLIEPKRQIDLVIKKSGVLFTPHDLRRTFITAAESLDIAPYSLKRLINHKMSGDITASYIISDVERLRLPVNKVNDFLVEKLGIDQSRDLSKLASG